jgi:hypothetical protein
MLCLEVVDMQLELVRFHTAVSPSERVCLDLLLFLQTRKLSLTGEGLEAWRLLGPQLPASLALPQPPGFASGEPGPPGFSCGGHHCHCLPFHCTCIPSVSVLSLASTHSSKVTLGVTPQ